MTETDLLQKRWDAVMMPNYGTPQLALAHGQGATVTDVDGRIYLDLLAGIAVNILGHCHPAIIEAVIRQLTTLGHTSNLYAHEPGIALAEALVAQWHVEDARVFFCNSGAEANELAFKLSRLTGRTRLVAAYRAFHGRTMGALALTGQPEMRQPFVPLPGEVTHVPYGDVTALEAEVTAQTAAVILEPILGEAGVVMPPPGYLAAAREITHRHRALLIVDEVQTGMGRTGTFFAHQHDGISPDIVTVAKGLGGGLPIGACLAAEPVAAMLRPGMHGSTFGGNPVCAAAALAVLRTLHDDALIERAGQLGTALRRGIQAIDHPLVAEVRGRGLLCGVELRQPAARAFETAARAAGFLVNAAKPHIVRLAPPLVITEGQIGEFLAALPRIFERTTSDATHLSHSF